jgi:SAM-dependent methyltransferase
MTSPLIGRTVAELDVVSTGFIEPPKQTEAERIEAVYRERDARAEPSRSPWERRDYRLRMQELEWVLLEELGRAGVAFSRARVAEIGCGSGYFLGRMLDYGAVQAVGIDLMQDRIAAARARDPRLELTVGDAAQLPWADGSFDIVTQFTCLSSILDRDVRAQVVAEMWRVLRPGGAIVSYDMRVAPPLVRAVARIFAAAATLRRASGGAPRTPTTPVELTELRGMLADAAVESRSLTLDGLVASIAGRSAAAARVLGSFSALRTHLLVIAVKRP